MGGHWIDFGGVDLLGVWVYLRTLFFLVGIIHLSIHVSYPTSTLSKTVQNDPGISERTDHLVMRP